MAVTATEFEYDGIKSSVYGLYICSFDGARNGTYSLGDEITIQSVKSPRGNRYIKTGSIYENPLSFTFQVIKYDCDTGAEKINARELATIMRWLVRSDNYHYLRFIQDRWDNVFYNCSLKVQKHEIGGAIYGLEIEATCDAPWGYSDMKKCNFSLDSDQSYHLYNYSDENGRLMPELVKIKILENCDEFILTNTFLPQNNEDNKIVSETKIKNCTAGEIFQFDRYRNIKSSMEHKNLQNEFNYQFLELLCDFFSQKNNIEANHSCEVEISYREIRKGVC